MAQYKKPQKSNLWAVLDDAVKRKKMNLPDAQYFQGIVESRIISDAEFRQILKSSVRPESVGRLAALVRKGSLDAREMRKQLLETQERKVSQEQINELLLKPRGKFFEALNWLDHTYKLPAKFKQDIITKRMRQKKLFEVYKKWQWLVEQKRAATRQIYSEKISEKQAWVEESPEEIQAKIDKLLSEI